MPVHLYGLMADMDPLVAIAERHGLTIVEDAAQAHGATYRGRRAGQFGPAMFSLYATKNLMTGEGGFATTDDDDLADRIRLFRNHGMRVRYHHESLGSNYKPTDLAAAIGLAQLARLDERTAQRRRNAAFLTEGLAGYLTPGVPDGREHVWHQYTMRFPGEREPGHRRSRRARRRHAHLLPGADPPPGLPPADHARRGRPAAAGHGPAVGGDRSRSRSGRA